MPVVSTLGGWALLGETISMLTVVGFLVIFAGFAVLGSESVDLRRFVPSTRMQRHSTTEQFLSLEDARGERAD